MSLGILWHYIDRSALEKPGWNYQPFFRLACWQRSSVTHIWYYSFVCYAHTTGWIPSTADCILLDILALPHIKPARWLLTLALSGLSFKQGTFTSAILFILLRPQKKRISGRVDADAAPQKNPPAEEKEDGIFLTLRNVMPRNISPLNWSMFQFWKSRIVVVSI